MNLPASERTTGDWQLECMALRDETPDARTFVFAVPADWPGFDAGQFLTFTFEIDGEAHSRSYSISSSALTTGRVSISVKRVAGGTVSNWLLDRMRPGMTLRASGPAGLFCCGPSPVEPVLLLTAGSGITPAASMIRSLADRGSLADVVLLHFATTPGAMLFLPEMPHWARQLPGLRVIPVMTRPRRGGGWVGPVGRLGPALVQGLVPDLAQRRIYCCGPAGFMTLAQQVVTELGVPEGKFLTESFDSAPEADEPAATEGALRYQISFAKAGVTGAMDAETTVLKAAKALGAKIPTSCGKGICGTCRVRLLSGQVDIRHQGGIKPREIEQGYILACCSRPLSDIVIDR